MEATLVFLLKAFVISWSGVMAPGPITAATIAVGTHRRHAGLMVALGHAAIELPLMLLIMLGIGEVFQIEGVKIGIGLIGGAFLILLGVQMLIGLRKPFDSQQPANHRHPFWTGVILTGANPYFLLWWVSIGLALTVEALHLGVLAFGLFALIHWLCDLVWLEALSIASHQGSKLMGPQTQKVILAICAAALLVFGVMFIHDAGGKWIAPPDGAPTPQVTP